MILCYLNKKKKSLVPFLLKKSMSNPNNTADQFINLSIWSKFNLILLKFL